MNIEQIVDFAQANSAPEHYSPAPEKILKGDPKQSVRNHYGSPCGQFNAGIWEGAVGQWTVNYTEHEYCEIIQGVSVLRDRHGNAKTVRAGDRFVIPAGFQGTWEVLEACRKVYGSSKPRPEPRLHPECLLPFARHLAGFFLCASPGVRTPE